jgi:hypothetical protein
VSTLFRGAVDGGAVLKRILLAVTMLLPWTVRRRALKLFFGYSLHPTSRIGIAWVLPKHLVMEEHSRIGHLTVCKGMDLLHLGAHAWIGRLNWITAYPSSADGFFRDEAGRSPQLVLGKHAAITNRHIVDCSSSVTIGEFSTVAGWRSQILTHSIDLELNRQTSRPVQIGSYCFVGTDCVVLGGSALPDFSVLGAKSLLNKRYIETHYLYGGTPSRPVKRLDERTPYFSRLVGIVG